MACSQASKSCQFIILRTNISNEICVANIFHHISEIRPNPRGTISFRERNFHLISHRRRVHDNGGKSERVERVVGSRRAHASAILPWIFGNFSVSRTDTRHARRTGAERERDSGPASWEWCNYVVSGTSRNGLTSVFCLESRSNRHLPVSPTSCFKEHFSSGRIARLLVISWKD